MWTKMSNNECCEGKKEGFEEEATAKEKSRVALNRSSGEDRNGEGRSPITRLFTEPTRVTKQSVTYLRRNLTHSLRYATDWFAYKVPRRRLRSSFLVSKIGMHDASPDLQTCIGRTRAASACASISS